jgi:hypothetical protein
MTSFIASGSHYAETSTKVYYKGEYSSDHWATQPYKLNDPKVIALAYFKDSEYAIYMNPTDKRGYRCIARFIKNDNMESTINRDYTSQERIGLGLIVQLIAEVYNQIVPISQTAVAGNNSHKFDSETGITYLGKAEEPSFLHGHIFGRGNPEGQYIEDVKLDGPAPGLNFDMMARTPSELGNNVKVKWKEGDMEKVVYRLKIEIEKSKKEYEEMGLRIITV